MILFSDPMIVRGGGQVVLEHLLKIVATEHSKVVLVMPRSGAAQLDLPATVSCFDSYGAFKLSAEFESLRSSSEKNVLVSNANRSFPQDIAFVNELRMRGCRVASVAIMHSYPRDVARLTIVRQALRRFDDVVAVEPGLMSVFSDVRVLPWLTALNPEQFKPITARPFTGKVKCFARPDPSKGLHLLADVFAALGSANLECRVALGASVLNDVRYERRLRTNLNDWLVPGRRDSSWIEAGDIFLVPSVAGETTCLAAQEAILAGAFVVSSRVGILPYLFPTEAGLETRKTGDSMRMADAVLQVAGLPQSEFTRRTAEGMRMLRERKGQFGQAFAKLVADLAVG